MEILDTKTKLADARRMREIIAAGKGAVYDATEDVYVFTEDGKQKKLVIYKVGDRYQYQIRVE